MVVGTDICIANFLVGFRSCEEPEDGNRNAFEGTKEKEDTNPFFKQFTFIGQI